MKLLASVTVACLLSLCRIIPSVVVAGDESQRVGGNILTMRAVQENEIWWIVWMRDGHADHKTRFVVIRFKNRPIINATDHQETKWIIWSYGLAHPQSDRLGNLTGKNREAVQAKLILSFTDGALSRSGCHRFVVRLFCGKTPIYINVECRSTSMIFQGKGEFKVGEIAFPSKAAENPTGDSDVNRNPRSIFGNEVFLAQLIRGDGCSGSSCGIFRAFCRGISGLFGCFPLSLRRLQQAPSKPNQEEIKQHWSTKRNPENPIFYWLLGIGVIVGYAGAALGGWYGTSLSLDGRGLLGGIVMLLGVALGVALLVGLVLLGLRWGWIS